MTGIEALENSIIVWKWLSENPKMDKCDCTIIDTTDWWANCSICDTTEDDGCSDCQMFERWPSHYGYVRTCLGDSAYEHFNYFNAIEYDKSFFALILVESFEKRLKELKEEL